VGSWQILETGSDAVLGIRVQSAHGLVVAVHNLSDGPQHVKLGLQDDERRELTQLFADEASEGDRPKSEALDMAPFGYRWFRIGDIR
jgi:maltose alpha-D-glucosyltransferase/alpha-amylase